MTFSGVSYLGILIAAIAGWVVGAIWYTVLARPWMEAQGKTPREFKALRAAHWKSAPWLPFVAVFVADIVMAWVLAGLLAHLGAAAVTVWNGVISALFVWVGFVATTIATNNMFGMRRFMLTAIDAGHWLAVLVVMGIVIGAFGA